MRERCPDRETAREVFADTVVVLAVLCAIATLIAVACDQAAFLSAIAGARS